MKTAIITGVNEGLGLEISRLLVTQGWKIIGISRHKGEIGEHIEGDLTKDDDIKKIVTEIKEKYFAFDILINCAGKLNITELNKLEYSEVENLFKLNVLAPIMLISGLIDLIKSNEADIVNIGSTIGFKAYEKQLAYRASKWAVRGINENLRLELKGTRCRVIGFNPGGFKSRIFEKATGEKIDLAPFMDPKDLANIIVNAINQPKTVEISEIIVNRK